MNQLGFWSDGGGSGSDREHEQIIAQWYDHNGTL